MTCPARAEGIAILAQVVNRLKVEDEHTGELWRTQSHRVDGRYRSYKAEVGGSKPPAPTKPQ
jgi:hypothetical protein